jgi:CCR4-NOT complex subunit CAF16
MPSYDAPKRASGANRLAGAGRRGITLAVSPAICVRNLSFHYPGEARPVLSGLDLDVPAGARCLLVGANGAGKTTLLAAIAGRHLLPAASIQVLGRPAFHDTTLAGRVAFLGGQFPFDVDLRVAEIVANVAADPARRARLMTLLAVDPAWRMHRVSDGQRRRVQMLLGLLQPREVLLLDEVTTDLDVIARGDLFAFLREESETRGLTILYATHILDGLDGWATHLCHLAGGRVRFMGPLDQIAELAGASLHELVDTWLRRHGV